jgi:hypothetical protein
MNVKLEYNMSFTAGVWWEQRLIMNNYMVRVYMLTNCEESANQNTAFERLKYFIYNELSSTIFVNRDCEPLCKHLAAAGIKMTTLPAEPVDQLIGIMLYSKLNAIMEDRIVINELAISSELGDNMIYLQTADETLGPFEPPGWWHDSNLIHYDLTLIDSDKVVAMHRAGAWRELGLTWAEQEPTPDSDNRVVFADFNPDNETK